MKKRQIHKGAAWALVVCLAGFSGISPASATTFNVVFDATDDALAMGDPGVFVFPEKPGDSLCAKELLSDETFPAEKLGKRYLDVMKQCGQTRLVAEKGDRIAVWVYFSDTHRTPMVAFDGNTRNQRHGRGIKKIYKRAGKSVFVDKNRPAAYRIREDFVLTKSRKKLPILLTYAEKADKDLSSAEFLLTIAPIEHWFLSIDLPLNDARMLRYDKASNSLVEKDVESSFYLGINYLLGDVHDENTPRNHRWMAKFLVKASDRPLDSIGLALGYRMSELNRSQHFGFGDHTFGNVSVFLGSFWDKSDDFDGIVVRERDAYTQSWRVGIGFNLDKVASWIK
ncbi:MAG: hypothetical protein D6698_16230 [Gammaproteobacteria bacterium]|nr:MAG: hypothetical protein D6698_16230 [Gammaproteobacteria bacterium]